jgi:hypothetical protein
LRCALLVVVVVDGLVLQGRNCSVSIENYSKDGLDPESVFDSLGTSALGCLKRKSKIIFTSFKKI